MTEEWIIGKAKKNNLGLKVRFLEFFEENLIEILNYDLSGTEISVYIEIEEVDALISALREIKRIRKKY